MYCKSKLIPKNAVVNIATCIGRAPVGDEGIDPCLAHSKWSFHLFVVGHRFLEVQCRNTYYRDMSLPMHSFEEEHDEQIAIIESLLHSAPLDHRLNWAQLVVCEGGYELIEVNQPPFVPCMWPTWAPIISEDDLEITTYGIPSGDFYAIADWDGREVDIQVAYRQFQNTLFNKRVRGFWLLRGLDLCFELLAHIERDGQIVGNVIEPAQGRMVQYRDRNKVYEAFATLKRRNLIITPLPGSIMIHNGKVRFVDVDFTRLLKKSELEEEYGKLWPRLDAMFQELRDSDNAYGPMRLFTSVLVPLHPFGSPQRSILGSILVVRHTSCVATMYSYYLEHRREFNRARKRRRDRSYLLKPRDEWLEWIYNELLPHLADTSLHLPSASPSRHASKAITLFDNHRKERAGRTYSPETATICEVTDDDISLDGSTCVGSESGNGSVYKSK